MSSGHQDTTCKNCRHFAVPQSRLGWATPVCFSCVKPSDAEKASGEAQECSICRSYHGMERIHESE